MSTKEVFSTMGKWMAFNYQPDELAWVWFSTVRVDLSGEAEVEAESFIRLLVIGSRLPAPRPLSRFVELSVFIKFLWRGGRWFVGTFLMKIRLAKEYWISNGKNLWFSGFPRTLLKAETHLFFDVAGPGLRSLKIIRTSNIVYLILPREYLPLSGSVKSNLKQDIKFV